MCVCVCEREREKECAVIPQTFPTDGQHTPTHHLTRKQFPLSHTHTHTHTHTHVPLGSFVGNVGHPLKLSEIFLS